MYNVLLWANVGEHSVLNAIFIAVEFTYLIYMKDPAYAKSAPGYIFLHVYIIPCKSKSSLTIVRSVIIICKI